MRSLSYVALLFVPLFLAKAVGAQTRLPSETELRAAYCIPLLQSEIETLRQRRASEVFRKQAFEFGRKMMAEKLSEPERAVFEKAMAMAQMLTPDSSKIIEARENALNRVTLYLQPRLQFLDDSSMSAAAKNAEADWREWSGLPQQCRRDCDAVKSDANPNAFMTCVSQCVRGDLYSRLDVCRKPDWLPAGKD